MLRVYIEQLCSAAFPRLCSPPPPPLRALSRHLGELQIHPAGNQPQVYTTRGHRGLALTKRVVYTATATPGDPGSFHT